MTQFKTFLLATATVIGLVTSPRAETQMDLVRSWLSQLAPELDKMTAGLSAGPNLNTCEASSNVEECNQRKFDDLSARATHARLFLDHNPAPRCLHNTETKVHQMLTMMETTLELNRNSFPSPLERRKAELMSDAIDQFGKNAATQARRDVLTCIFGGQKNYLVNN